MRPKPSSGKRVNMRPQGGRRPTGGESLSAKLLPMLKRLEGAQLDTDDLLLLLILYLMYRESGDWEMLIMMGAMLFA